MYPVEDGDADAPTDHAAMADTIVTATMIARRAPGEPMCKPLRKVDGTVRDIPAAPALDDRRQCACRPQDRH
jgi:hypothetical protein